WAASIDNITKWGRGGQEDPGPTSAHEITNTSYISQYQYQKTAQLSDPPAAGTTRSRVPISGDYIARTNNIGVGHPTIAKNQVQMDQGSWERTGNPKQPGGFRPIRKDNSKLS
ncbi:furin-like protease 2-like protein, partial [Lasius niger]